MDRRQASARSGHSPRANLPHFVDSPWTRGTFRQFHEDIRQMQDECWRGFNERAGHLGLEGTCGSVRFLIRCRIELVRAGQAFARKAFDVDFLSIENERDKEAEKFYVKTMGLQVTRNYANFPVKFSDATPWPWPSAPAWRLSPGGSQARGLS